VLFPFLLRPLAAECWAERETLFDITSPPGYGGAFAWNCPADHGPLFWEAFRSWARAARLVSGFVRLSLFPEQRLAFCGQVENRLSNVVRSLELAPAEIWRDYERKVRLNVARARRSGLRFEVDPQGKRLDAFLAVYYETMQRRQAAAGYFFSREFFQWILAELPGQFVFFHVLDGGQVVASEVALLSASRIYSFLGGSLAAALPARPNDLLKHQAILWARDAGYRQLVLGGGHAEQDGIFRFKRSFAPGGVRPFQVGVEVYDERAYCRLEAHRRAWEQSRGVVWRPAAGYFPSYRASA
jgi:hypothetical protein